jgi:CRISPR-associated protein Cmr2
MQCEPLVRTLAELTHEYGEPSPYLGVLVADGDHIGQALSRLGSADDHKAFSKTLADFASEARQIVQSHNGVLVYAGGDDVLAFMPIDRCLPCSRALHDKFSEVLATWSTRTGAELTLSVGLAIAHFMEPLEDLLGYGRAAERHAKRPRPEDHEQRDRDGLAVHLLKRGGEPITVRANWSVEPDKHIRQLAKWIVSRAVTGSVAYELHKLADVYESWPSTTVKDAIRHNALSVIRGKQSQALSRISEIEGFIKARVDGADSLRHLASELLIARQLAVAIGQMSASPVWEKSL